MALPGRTLAVRCPDPGPIQEGDRGPWAAGARGDLGPGDGKAPLGLQVQNLPKKIPLCWWHKQVIARQLAAGPLLLAETLLQALDGSCPATLSASSEKPPQLPLTINVLTI